MGTLDEDGLVGPYTLNGLRHVTEKLGGKHWPDIVKEAKNKGFAKPAIAELPTTKPKVAKAAIPGALPPLPGGVPEEPVPTAPTKKKGSALPLVAGAAVVFLLMAKK